ncbi:GH25 family lysozyme [Argonema galeatum]|uniref:GH25 family lysozyme n=1 Tax=Argonema galeatum TaxID=2942762 RepID=UPI002010FC75|nr:GH25 family lysozyme [Argonema galeatum]MCL1463241.1 peptidoglycan-binding protein [Argonema galeatum A003/A1]
MVSTKLPILRRGDGIDFPELQDDVKLLQTKLGFFGDNIDGKFGLGTEKSVKHFQQGKGLEVDGIVAKNTWSAILDAPVEVFNPRIIGIDVSMHNKIVDWQAVKKANISYAFAKATEGGDFVDQTFATNWLQMKQAGIIRGAYHFFRPLKTGEQQADNFLKTLGNLELSDLSPVVDLEQFPESVAKQWKTISFNQRIDRVQKFLHKVEQVTGRKPIIYTSNSFWQEFMNNSEVFTAYRLWIAHYTDKPQPLVPANNWGGKGWTLWQYTETGVVAGVTGKFDINRFNGSIDKLI